MHVEARSPSAREGWQADGACKEHPGAWWFDHDRKVMQRAKAICDRCLVRAECLEHALARRELSGIWGATAPSERDELRRLQPALEASVRVHLRTSKP